jgi:hypothetical protein
MKIPFKILYPLANVMNKDNMNNTALCMIAASKASIDHTIVIVHVHILVVINTYGQ